MENINNKDRLQIIDKNTIIANIYADKENLFSFDTIPDFINKNDKNDNKIFKSNYIDYSLWHSRLGHFNNNKDIEKFVYEHTSFHNKKDCPQCKISKLKRKPFFKSESFSTQPLELVHTDVVGPLELSYQGFSYYVTFLDDYTRKCWIYNLKNKSEVFNKIIEFHKLVSNLYNLNIKTFKSDNGTEYINNNVINYLHDH
eukprot:jgi/Orpsp1_1/1177447/evm.model.c7180000061473.1